MRKLILFVFLLLLAGTAATPFYFGYQAKHQFKQMVAAISKTYTELDIEIVDYKLGWLSSDAQVQLTYHLRATSPKAPQETLIEIIDGHIVHGPVLQDPATKHFALGFARIETHSTLSGVNYKSSAAHGTIFNAATFIDLKNNWHTNFTIPTLHFSTANQQQFSMKSGKGTLDFITNNSLNAVNLNVVFQGLTSTFNPGAALNEIMIDSIRFESHDQQQLTGIWTRHTKVTLPNLTIKKMDHTQMTVNETFIERQTSTANPNLYNVNLHLTAQKIQTPSSLLPSIGPLDFSLAMNNLSISGLQAISNCFSSLNYQAATTPELQTCWNLAPKILTPTTMMTENFATNTSLGSLQSDGTLSWKNAQALPTTPQEVFHNMSVFLNLTIASPLVDQLLGIQGGAANLTPSAQSPTSVNLSPEPASAPMSDTSPIGSSSSSLTTLSPAATTAEQNPPSLQEKFTAWLQQGYVSKEGNNYIIRLKFENGLTTLNDKPFQQ